MASTDQKPGDLPRSVTIPTKILESGLFSQTSLASDCFVKQQFSQRLQAYMVGYVNTIYSQFPIAS